MSSENKNQQDDLTDSVSDQERLKPETAIFDLPDVSEIPGQEHVHVAPLGELADTTISSDDEEGLVNDDSDSNELFNDEDEDNRDGSTEGIP